MFLYAEDVLAAKRLKGLMRLTHKALESIFSIHMYEYLDREKKWRNPV
jgi:hypothetical protein